MSVIVIGTALTAPEGFECLEKDCQYYFVRSDPARDRVLLIEFQMRERKHKATTKQYGTSAKRGARERVFKAVLFFMRRSSFEVAVESGAIRPAADQPLQPPWLVAPSSATGSKRAVANGDKLARGSCEQVRLAMIKPLIERDHEVLDAEDPNRAIGTYARSQCQPRQNAARLQLWFWLYLLFGRRPEVLAYSSALIGRWPRLSTQGEKRGRGSRLGQRHGYNVDEAMRERIITAYDRECGLGIDLTEIYETAMIGYFGCRSHTTKGGFKRFRHPGGEPFPTFDQFEYHIVQRYGRKGIRLTRLGSTRVRHEKQPARGQFSQAVANVMERVEADGYISKEVTRGLIDQTMQPPLCVVHGCDFMSGLRFGIGFSQGAERGSAYRAMLFCAAVDKVWFCRLFGIEIEPEEWPSVGLPPHLSVDRGPGATRSGCADDPEAQPVIRELALAYDGQSKANIETRHPKTLATDGAPTHIASGKRPIELARSAIYRLLRDNQRTDVSSRLTPQMLADGVAPLPNAIWRWCTQRGRNDAQQMPRDTAIRTFLKKVEFTVRSDGVYLRQQKYDSEALRACGILDRVATGSVLRVNGYMFEMCVRHVWLEVEGQIVEIDMQLGVRDHPDQLYMSINELEELERIRLANAAEMRENRRASGSEFDQRCIENTGFPITVKKRAPGRAKRRSPRGLAEAAESSVYTASGPERSRHARKRVG